MGIRKAVLQGTRFLIPLIVGRNIRARAPSAARELQQVGFA